MSTTVLPYMHRQKEQTFQTESYVSTPPALFIVDERGDVWTLGMNMQRGPTGEFAFNVLCNGEETGEVASRIERRNGRVRVFTVSGAWKRWTGKSFF